MSPLWLIRPSTAADNAWLPDFWTTHWGSRKMVSRGKLWDVAEFPCFVAEQIDVTPPMVVGLLAYRMDATECEIMSMDSLLEGLGVGTALVAQLVALLKTTPVKRLWCITTNDNVHALRFWQKRGFTLCAIHINAIAASRQLKPEIPLIGFHEIPIRDELELEMWL